MFLPYGKGHIEFDAGKNHTVLSPDYAGIRADRAGIDIVRSAMEKPIGSRRLFELSKGKRTCTVIISDHTRPVPSRDILPVMLSELRQGNSNIEITLLVATGLHRQTTADELRYKLGDSIFGRERIAVHDCDDKENMVYLGQLPSGSPLYVNRIAAEADLLVSEGFIEPHFFAGFSGGRKSVLPGVSGRLTVLGNHCSSFIDHPCATTGVLENNPIHEDMKAAARMAGLAFIVNAIIDENKHTVAAFAGDPIAAHEAGCAYVKKYFTVDAIPADIVVTTNGGMPLDGNIYQCVKGLTAAEATANVGGIIIIAAECADGKGGEAFYSTLKNCNSPAELYDEIMAVPQDKTIPDQWQSQILVRVLKKHRVIFVTRPELKETVEEMKMAYAESIADAMAMARKMKGENASVTVIPDGVSVIVRKNLGYKSPVQYRTELGL